MIIVKREGKDVAVVIGDKVNKLNVDRARDLYGKLGEVMKELDAEIEERKNRTRVALDATIPKPDDYKPKDHLVFNDPPGSDSQ